MQIENMSQQDQIMIQGAKIINQNYSINWLASRHIGLFQVLMDYI